MTICAIHQPNFFPWLGYFHKMINADIFVILDDVQYPKTGGSWGNRVQFLQQGNPFWLTMPIIRGYHGVRTYQEIEINHSTFWQKKAIKTIESSYKKSPYFKCYYPLIENLLNFSEHNLVRYNLNTIYHIMDLLDIDKSCLKFSSDMKISSTGTDRLIEIAKLVQADTYLCGGGAMGYQEDEKFLNAGIRLTYQNFIHPVYTQYGTETFIAGLSIFDCLFNSGIEFLYTNLLKNNIK